MYYNIATHMRTWWTEYTVVLLDWTLLLEYYSHFRQFYQVKLYEMIPKYKSFDALTIFVWITINSESNSSYLCFVFGRQELPESYARLIFSCRLNIWSLQLARQNAPLRLLTQPPHKWAAIWTPDAAGQA